jgi:hypothetical protein
MKATQKAGDFVPKLSNCPVENGSDVTEESCISSIEGG